MARSTPSVASKARRKKILKMAKGYRGRNKNVLSVARQKVDKGLQYQYRDRRNKKRDFRALWIQRINAATRLHGLTYSKLIHGLKLANVELDRKSLSEIAIFDPATFEMLVNKAKEQL